MISRYSNPTTLYSINVVRVYKTHAELDSIFKLFQVCAMKEIEVQYEDFKRIHFSARATFKTSEEMLMFDGTLRAIEHVPESLRANAKT